MSFSHETKYLFDFFNYLKMLKAVLSTQTGRNRWWAGFGRRAVKPLCFRVLISHPRHTFLRNLLPITSSSDFILVNNVSRTPGEKEKPRPFLHPSAVTRLWNISALSWFPWNESTGVCLVYCLVYYGSSFLRGQGCNFWLGFTLQRPSRW